jgi:hypothetical protein
VATRYPGDVSTSCRLRVRVRGESPAKVRNISVSGIGLIAEETIDPGAVITIELRNVVRLASRTLQAQVVYCLDHPNGASIVGAKFTQELSEADLKLFIR